MSNDWKNRDKLTDGPPYPQPYPYGPPGAHWDSQLGVWTGPPRTEADLLIITGTIRRDPDDPEHLVVTPDSTEEERRDRSDARWRQAANELYGL